MNPKDVHGFLMPACLALFPQEYNSREARAMMIAIGLQESDFQHRQQLIGNHRNWWQSLSGPAVSYWQFERIGIRGVLEHRVTGPLIRVVLEKLGYPADVETIFKAITHNDILAVCFARLLIFTVPQPLPGRAEVDGAWSQYLWAWRPGKPKPERWAQRYELAWQIVSG